MVKALRISFSIPFVFSFQNDQKQTSLLITWSDVVPVGNIDVYICVCPGGRCVSQF